jgi:CRP-like cAMP-binding protein
MKQLLEKIDFFSGLDRKLLEKVSDAALLRSYPPGEVIIRQGEMGLGLYAIFEGRVKVEREHEGVSRELAVLGPQQFFAEISMVDSKPRSATVTTLEQTECMLLTRDSFIKLVKSYPDLALRLARVLAERLRAADEKLAAQEEGTPPAVRNGAAAAAATPVAGTANGSPAGEVTGKAKVQASLLNTFAKLYSMKALVRFSVAVLGCPVEGSAPNIAGQIRVGEAKAILLPAGEEVAMDIVAGEQGAFTLHVFTPDREDPVAYGPLPIDCLDGFQLRMGRGAVALWNSDEMIAPAAGCA